jgi:hypothetical protein
MNMRMNHPDVATLLLHSEMTRQLVIVVVVLLLVLLGIAVLVPRHDSVCSWMDKSILGRYMNEDVL